jgi:hypothetical protein
MENMSLEQLIATFGPEVGAQMFAQMSAGAGAGGNKAPFTFVKKVATHGSELGAFGDFCINVETEKNDDGKRVVTNKGENLGNSFEFLIVNVSYRYRLWDEVKQRTVQSNIFETLDGIKTAVNVYDGKPLPADKQAKKDAGWKLVRINGGLIRKNSKSAWTPAIWETDGMLYFTLGEVISKKPNGGLLSGVINVVTKLDSKGATQFSVIDTNATTFESLPKDLFTKAETKEMLSDITVKMGEYRSNAQYTGASAAPANRGTQSGSHSEGNDESTDW